MKYFFIAIVSDPGQSCHKSPRRSAPRAQHQTILAQAPPAAPATPSARLSNSNRFVATQQASIPDTLSTCTYGLTSHGPTSRTENYETPSPTQHPPTLPPAAILSLGPPITQTHDPAHAHLVRIGARLPNSNSIVATHKVSIPDTIRACTYGLTSHGRPSRTETLNTASAAPRAHLTRLRMNTRIVIFCSPKPAAPPREGVG